MPWKHPDRHGRSPARISASFPHDQQCDVARSIGLGVYEYDFVTGDVKWSAEFRDMLGLGEDADVSGDEHGDWIFPEDQPRILAAWQQAITPGGSGEFEEEYRIVRPDGRIIWVMDKGRIFFDDVDGASRPVRGSGVLLNISSRKHAEAARRIKRERLAAALAASKTGTFHWNIVTGELEFDDSMLHLWGLSPEQAPHHLDEAVAWVHADDRDRLLKMIEGDLERVRDVEVEYRVCRPDGEQRWVLAKGRPLTDSKGKPLFMTGACVDITHSKQTETALRREIEARDLEHRRLEAVLDALPLSVFITDADGKIVQANAASMTLWANPRLSQYPEEYARDFKGWQIHDGQRIEIKEWGLARALRSGETVSGDEVEIEAQDGSHRTILYHASPVRDDDQRILGAVAVSVDITERRHAEDRMRYLADIVASSRDSIVSLTFDGRVTSWNEGAERLYGFTAEEAVGRHVRFLDPSISKNETQKLLELVKQGKRIGARETIRRRKDGQDIWVSFTISPILNAHGQPTGASIIARDITERKQMEAMLQHDALHDKLTGLGNRVLFIDRLSHVIDRAQRYQERYAAFVMDIDNFKLINDTFGHLVGDQLLYAFSQRIQEVLRPVDTMARFGGDEFMLLLEEVDNQHTVLQIADRIQECLKDPFELSGREIRIGSSVGITLGDAHYLDPDDVIRDADLALYEAKRRGKAQYVIFDSKMRNQRMARLHLEAELRQALERRTLKVDFQPIVDLASQRMLGCEALVRWKHPVMGRVDPEQFLEVARETGLIMQLGQFVLEQACEAVAAWLTIPVATQDFYVSINISSKEFYSPDLLPLLDSLLNRYQLRGANLRLEIGEDVIMEREQLARSVLNALHGRGIAVCIDNFGRGTSSLNYLHQLPIEIVKIDCSLVQRLPDDVQCREVTRSILHLADVLNFQSIAECTETIDQVEQAKAVGFHSAQGFALYQPMERGAIQQLLREAEVH